MKTWMKLRNDPDLWNRYDVRAGTLDAIRDFFRHKRYREVETPVLTPYLPPESYIEVFETALLSRQRVARKAYMPTSPELFLKKLLAAGSGSCFALTKAFRNTESESRSHNPEFTILEWYTVGADYHALMDETVEFIRSVVGKVTKGGAANGALTISYQGQEIRFDVPWERITVDEAFEKYAGIGGISILPDDELKRRAQARGYDVRDHDTWEQVFNQIFLNEIEGRLSTNKPTIIYDYPQQLAALAGRIRRDNPHIAERFEVYLGGIELCDGCTELTDWREQEQRFAKEQAERLQLGKTEYPIDVELIEALKMGLPECAGIALGVDRLVMVLADVPRIDDTLFFPASEEFG